MDKIEKFKIVIGGFIHFEYDELEIHLFFKKFNENCLCTS